MCRWERAEDAHMALDALVCKARALSGPALSGAPVCNLMPWTSDLLPVRPSPVAMIMLAAPNAAPRYANTVAGYSMLVECNMHVCPYIPSFDSLCESA